MWSWPGHFHKFQSMGNASTEVPGVLNSINEQGLKPVFKPFSLELIPLFHLGCVLSDMQLNFWSHYVLIDVVIQLEIFSSTTHTLIGYFEVTWHLTMKRFPAKIPEWATLQNLWRLLTSECWPLARFIFLNLYTKRFFFVSYITSHLKTSPSGNS